MAFTTQTAQNALNQHLVLESAVKPSQDCQFLQPWPGLTEDSRTTESGSGHFGDVWVNFE